MTVPRPEGISSATAAILDPTANVIALVHAEARRQDDLRNSERRRVNEQIKLRAKFSAQLRKAETKRLDAIRAVDVNAISIATERAGATAATLAAQLTQVTMQLSDRVAALEKMGYVGTGKQAIADPLFDDLMGEIKAMKETISMHKGRSLVSTQILVAVATIVGGLIVFLVQRLFIN